MADDIEVTEAKVTYTTKELLKRIDDRFERLEAMVTGAPTRVEVDHIDARVKALEAEAVALRATAQALSTEKTQRWSRNEKLAAVSFGMLNVIVNALLLHFTVDGI